MKVKITKLHPQAKVPEYKTPGSVGCDVYSIEEVTIHPGEIVMIKTGVAIQFPVGYFGLLAPRSSICLKKHLAMTNSVGIFDNDYTDEVIVSYRNIGTEPVTLEKHERIAQFIFTSFTKVEFEEVSELEKTERKGGFGSTGKK